MAAWIAVQAPPCNAQGPEASSAISADATATAGTTITKYASAIAISVDEETGVRILDINDIYTVKYGGPQDQAGGSEFLSGGGRAVLEFPIPPQAWELGSVRELQGLQPDQYGRVANGVGISAPLSLGDEVTYHFQYFLQATDLSYGLRFSYPVERVLVLIQAPLIDGVHPHGLRDDGERDIPGAGPYHLFAAETQPAGYELVLAIHEAELPREGGGHGLVILLAHLVALAFILMLLGGAIWLVIQRRRRMLAMASGTLDASPLDNLDAVVEAKTVSEAKTVDPAPAPKRGRPKRRRKRSTASEIDHLADTIARLDLRYEDGDLEEDLYREKRQQLKQELADAVREHDSKG